MLVARDFRQRAREALRGNWGFAVATGFVASLLGAVTYNFGSGSNANFSEEETDPAGELFLAFLDRVTNFSESENGPVIVASVLAMLAVFTLVLAVV